MVVHAVVTRRERMTCKSGGVEGAPSLSHFHHKPSRGVQISLHGGSTHILTPCCSHVIHAHPYHILNSCSHPSPPPTDSSPSEASHPITLIYSRLSTKVARLSAQSSKSLLALPPLVRQHACIYHTDALLLPHPPLPLAY